MFSVNFSNLQVLQLHNLRLNYLICGIKRHFNGDLKRFSLQFFGTYTDII
jgi:hypothetical protein